MKKAFLGGLLSGCVLAFLFVKGRLGHHSRSEKREGHRNMTAEEKIVASMQELIEQHPDAATPSADFLRDWAYGNAGLEDERITVEQVEQVMREKTA
jgi:hypothetical protein